MAHTTKTWTTTNMLAREMDERDVLFHDGAWRAMDLVELGREGQDIIVWFTDGSSATLDSGQPVTVRYMV